MAKFNKNKIFSISPSLKKKRHLRETLPFLKMDNIAMDRENVNKFLSILIYENLSWKQDINDDNTKISKSIGILYKSRGIVKQPLFKQLYFSFIRCHLNYANIAWAK